jgi:poly(ADP-ribose) glycohydrolase ARH3
MKMDIRKSKILGAMLGSALGDAIGELAFLYPAEETLLHILSRAKELKYTDDTAMAIGLAESLIRENGLVQQKLGDQFSMNFHYEPWRGYASGPPTIFAMVREQGISYPEAARSLFGGQGSLGNGAAMRIAPVGLLYHDHPDLCRLAADSAEVTHAHPVGMDGAAIQAAAVARALALDPGEGFTPSDFLQELTGLTRTPEIRSKIAAIDALIRDGASAEEAAGALGRTVAVHESMPYALYSFLTRPGSFEACLFRAVLHGGDRDTLGAMACALSGAYLGLESLPGAWIERLENRDYIRELAITLADMEV